MTSSTLAPKGAEALSAVLDSGPGVEHDHAVLAFNPTLISENPRAAHAAPASGQASTPVAADIAAAAGTMSASGTATAVPFVSRRARRQRKPAMGLGTRSPYAVVVGTGQGWVHCLSFRKPSTTGAQPSDCTDTSRGRPGPIQPMVSISSKAFHIPMRPVPPSSRVDDHVRQVAIELFPELMTHGLFGLDPDRKGSFRVDRSKSPGDRLSASQRPESEIVPGTSSTRAPYWRHSSTKGRGVSSGIAYQHFNSGGGAIGGKSSRGVPGRRGDEASHP